MVVAAAVGGCSNDASVLDRNNWFSKPVDVFAKPDWARSGDANTAELGPKGQVSANDLVNPDGSCAPAEAPPAAAAPAEPAPAAPAADTAKTPAAEATPSAGAAPAPAAAPASPAPAAGTSGQ